MPGRADRVLSRYADPATGQAPVIAGFLLVRGAVPGLFGG